MPQKQISESGWHMAAVCFLWEKVASLPHNTWYNQASYSSIFFIDWINELHYQLRRDSLFPFLSVSGFLIICLKKVETLGREIFLVSSYD